MRERRLSALEDATPDRTPRAANRPYSSAGSANGWTGGQYSAVRFAIGAYLLVNFYFVLGIGELWVDRGVDEPLGPLAPAAGSIPLSAAEARALVAMLSLAVAAASALLALGVRDRIAAATLFCVVVGLLSIGVLSVDAGTFAIACLLLLQACLPRAPYGSWDARGRVDPAGEWRMPASVHAACWCALAFVYAYSGATALAGTVWSDGGTLAGLLASASAHDSPLRGLGLAHPQDTLSVTAVGVAALEIAFAPLALFRRARAWLWLVFLAAQIARLMLADGAQFGAGFALLHLFAFDPAWLRGRFEGPATIFYDGGCGLCHRTVRFALAEDRDGERFRFAPLEGRVFAAYREASARAQQLAGIDSIVLVLPDGRAIVRAAAILEIGSRLGGIWRAIAFAARALPRRALDAAYDAFARVRRRIFASPLDACPTLPPKLRERFDYP